MRVELLVLKELVSKSDVDGRKWRQNEEL